MTTWELDPSDGELLLTTGVTGPAAKMGHRLTIAVQWRATVQWDGDRPVSVEMTVDVSSLEVLGGEGGVTGLSTPEKALARANALKTLQAKRFPQIVFRTSSIEPADHGYLLHGTLDLHGRSRDRVLEVEVEDLGEQWQMACRASVSHADHGLKPYSMMMGAMKVADEVAVSFTARHPK